MTPKELLEIIQDYCNGDDEETIVTINELVESIQDDRFLFVLGGEVEHFADECNRCPCCGWTLQESRNKERSDCRGWEVEEDFITYNCINPDCDNY